MSFDAPDVEEIARVVLEVTRRAVGEEVGPEADLTLTPPQNDAPLVGLALRAELSELEVAILRVLHAASIDRHVYRCLQRLAADPSRPGVAVDALATVIEAIGGDPVELVLALGEQGVLATRGLIRVHGDARVPALSRRLTLPDRVVAYLVEGMLPTPAIDPWLVREPRPNVGSLCPVPVLEAPGAMLLDVLRGAIPELAGRPVWLVGRRGAGRKTMLAVAAAEHGLDVLTIAYRDAMRLPVSQLIATLWREALLARAIVCIADVDPPRERPHDGEPLPAGATDDDAVATLLGRLRAAELPVVFTSDHAPAASAVAESLSVYRADTPSPEAMLALWRACLPDTDGIEEMATRFRLTPGQVVRATTDARQRAGDRGSPAATQADVSVAISSSVARQVELLGTRVHDTQNWDDIVLPDDTLDAIRELLARVRYRHQVLDRWGFRAKLSKGLGLPALFSGPPGTGKTMVSSLIARELGQDLYQIDLSRIVSKWIGETEKNLARVFDAAEGANVVLLFDEADALFSKRTEVRSSNDRHSNAEVNYLHQRVERI